MFRAYREALTSALFSMMLTATFFPAYGSASQAGVIDPIGVNQALKAATAKITTDGWTAPIPGALMVVASAEGKPAQALMDSEKIDETIISQEKLRELIRLAYKDPNTHKQPEVIAVSLGLSQPGVPYLTRNVSFELGAARYTLQIADGADKLMLTRREGRAADVWASTLEGKLLAAGHANGQWALKTVEEARPGFEAALRLWASFQIPAPAPGNS